MSGTFRPRTRLKVYQVKILRKEHEQNTYFSLQLAKSYFPYHLYGVALEHFTGAIELEETLYYCLPSALDEKFNIGTPFSFREEELASYSTNLFARN